MMTPNKMLIKEITVSLWKSACKRLKTIYEHSMDKQEWKAILIIVPGVNIILFHVWQYVTYIANFKIYYIY